MDALHMLVPSSLPGMETTPAAGAGLAPGDAAPATPFAELLDALATPATEPAAMPEPAVGATETVATDGAVSEPAPIDAALAAQLAWQAAPVPPTAVATAPAPAPIDTTETTDTTDTIDTATGLPSAASKRPVAAADASPRTTKTVARTHEPPLATDAPIVIAAPAPLPQRSLRLDPVPRELPIAADLLAALAMRPHAAADVAAPAVATTTAMHATPDSPGFGAEFAARVSVLVQAGPPGGVQRAELRMNPAELGPVSVQVMLDGRDATINFGAEVGVTRAAIEASLPALAAALRESGLVLAGGGVSAQTPGDARHGAANGGHAQRDAAPGAPQSAEADAGPAIAATRRVVRSGGVDLYA